MVRISPIVLSALLLAVSSSAVASDTARCGSKLVSLGMTQAEVLEYCGEPTSRQVKEVPIRSGTVVTGTTTIERWTYESYSATRVFEFDQERLVSIE